MAEIIWTPFALEDLQSIHDYIALDSPNYATRYIDKLVDKTEILIDHPETGRIVPEFENELIRELIEGNYRIFRVCKINCVTSGQAPTPWGRSLTGRDC